MLCKVGDCVDIKVGDRLQMKKKHPCGNDIFTVTRIGMDFKLVCNACQHEVMLTRQKAEKAIKKIITTDGE